MIRVFYFICLDKRSMLNLPQLLSSAENYKPALIAGMVVLQVEMLGASLHSSEVTAKVVATNFGLIQQRNDTDEHYTRMKTIISSN